MSATRTTRRAVLIGVALTVSSLLLRAQISSALVVRGDELAFRGSERAAVNKYRLAFHLDQGNLAAADRFAFSALRLREPSLLQEALRATTDALAANRLNVTLIMDRALCLHASGAYGRAATDFEQVGRLRKDARAMTFAGLDLARVHRESKAREILRTAVNYDPAFLPARRALERSRTWRS